MGTLQEENMEVGDEPGENSYLKYRCAVLQTQPLPVEWAAYLQMNTKKPTPAPQEKLN